MWDHLLAVAILCASTPALGQHLGEPCTHKATRMTGKCLALDECEYAKENEIDQGLRPQNCFFRPGSSKPIVCCPQDGGEKISSRMCKLYSSRVFSNEDPRESTDCVMPTRRTIGPQILGGTPAKLKELPHMALLGYGPRANHTYACGGTLVSPTFVLTAAHCVSTTVEFVRWVRVGDLDISSDTDGAKPQIVEVEEFITHPLYEASLRYHDIALLRLKNPVEINAFARPACLRSATEDDHGTAVVAGWGATEWGGERSNTLLKVELEIRSQEDCQDAYPTDIRSLPTGINKTAHICAGGHLSKDSCNGDSGGPLMVRTLKDCLYHVTGVTSFGRGCGSTSPGVYTRVASYIPWIEGVVWAGGDKRWPINRAGDDTSSDRMCKAYSARTCTPQQVPRSSLLPGGKRIQPQISGGVAVTSARRFPHMALLGYERPDGKIHYGCGGALISENFVLTAAHCKEVTWVLLGAIFRNDTLTQHHPESRPQLIRVESRVCHPCYVAGEGYCDLQLLRLERPPEFNEFVRPACLSNEKNFHSDVTATGWGMRESNDENYSEQLMMVTLTSKPLSACEKVVERKWVRNGLDTEHLCVGGFGVSDTCKGDSGGPLVIPKTADDSDCMYSIVGVVSFGPTCGHGHPAVYASVPSHISWLEAVVWPNT